MKLVNTVSLLKDAQKGKYAVPAINVDQVDSLIGVLRACEKCNSPVIIQLSPIQVHTKDISYQSIIQMINGIGQDFDVELAIHLDHGVELSDIKKAISSGFTSVMYDGSKEKLDINIRNTLEIVRDAGNLSVEGELGVIGGEEGQNTIDGKMHDVYTNVKQAAEYVQNTGIDFLAIAIGNAHGVYTQKPKLNFERLKEISENIDIPLVLHGASGLSKDDIQKAISLGICKINFFTDIDRTYLGWINQEIKKEPEMYSFLCFHHAGQKVEEKTEEIIKMCKSAGKRRNYCSTEQISE